MMPGCTGVATTADHIIGKARGGSDNTYNLQASCKNCNEKKRIKQSDPVLKATAPASLATYRTLSETFPKAPASEEALWKVAEMYEDAKRYDLAAQALTDLGTRFPSTRYDAWFRAGEILERKVKDKARAKAAYANVPSSSPNYREAQDKARKLG